MSEQNYSSHRRLVPMYHFATFGAIAINAIWSLIRLVRFPSLDAMVALLLGLGLIGLFLYARLFALTAQDRLIRLEMQLHMAKLLPEALRARIDEFSEPQLIALRFASDAELPELSQQVLDEKISDREEIKKRIKHWKADNFRV